jgi:uncharacterized protein
VSRYDWDPEKAIEHGITFEEARSVELDPLRRIWPDPVHDAADERWLSVGLSNQQRLLLVVTSERGNPPRIISARRATKRERHAYETQP